MSQPTTIYCSIRKEWVSALPEEAVRQRLLRHMLDEKGFPETLVAVEKGLRQMPHLALVNPLKIPDRRADIICFAKGIHAQCDLYPLLLVECKAVKLTSRVINQVGGYNQFVKACFIAVVNDTEIRTGWFDPSQNGYTFVDYLPTYAELVRSVCPKGRVDT